MEAIERGNLAEKALLPLLTDLYRQRATGSLRLERAPLQKAVYFRGGQILFAASNDPKDQLASILVEEGKLSLDQMQLARARVSAGNPLAKVLTELGYISQRELAEAARLKVEKILTDLFTWKEGTYQFADKSLPKGAIDLELPTKGLLFNSIRKIEDRSWVIKELGSLETVLSPTQSLGDFIAETSPEPRVQKVMRSVDGTKSIKQISAESDLGDFEVSKIMAAAVMIGALRKAAPELGAEGQPSDTAAISVGESDAISFEVSEPLGALENEPLEHTIVDTEAIPLSFSPEEPQPPLELPESQAPWAASSSQPSIIHSEPPTPLAPSDSQTSAALPESQPPLGRPGYTSPPIPEFQQPRVSRKMKIPLGSPEPARPSSLDRSLSALQRGGVSGLLIDEPEPDMTEEAPHRAPPRPRRRGRAPTSGVGKKVLFSVAAILLLAIGGYTGYAYIWPMFSSESMTPGTESPTSIPTTDPRPPLPPAGTVAETTSSPPPSTPEDTPSTREGDSAVGSGSIPGRPGPPPPTTPSISKPAVPPSTSSFSRPGLGSPRPSPTIGPQPATPPPTRPAQPAPSPALSQPPPTPPRPVSSTSAGGIELLKEGRYSEAARSYLDELKNTGVDKFTIAVGVYCEAANVGQTFRNSGQSDRLIVLPYQYKGQLCYRVFWGLYDSQEAAQQGLASLPAAIRSSQSVPVPTSRLLR